MEFDTQLKLAALDAGMKIYESIVKAYNHPTRKIEGESLRIFEELEAWQFFEHYPIQKEEHRWLYITMIAAQQYRHLRWLKDHPPKSAKKPSKWEIVSGRTAKDLRSKAKA